MKEYAKVSKTVWRSMRFRALKTKSAKLTYHYLLTCEHNTSLGAYRLPLAYIAADLDDTEASVRADLQQITEVELAAYDFDHHVVAISKWFENSPLVNPNHLRNAIDRFHALPSTPILYATAIELVISAYTQAEILTKRGHVAQRSPNRRTAAGGATNIESAAKMFEEAQTFAADAIDITHPVAVARLASVPKQMLANLERDFPDPFESVSCVINGRFSASAGNGLNALDYSRWQNPSETHEEPTPMGSETVLNKNKNNNKNKTCASEDAER